VVQRRCGINQGGNCAHDGALARAFARHIAC
jgi:hypothetical protein